MSVKHQNFIRILFIIFLAAPLSQLDLMGQCPKQCNIGGTDYEAFDHEYDRTNTTDCNNEATGLCSFAVGKSCTTAANYTFVAGENSEIVENQIYSVALGKNSYVDGRRSGAFGNDCDILDNTTPGTVNSFALGSNIEVDNKNALSMGENLTNNGEYAITLGEGYTNNTDSCLIIEWRTATGTTAPVAYADLRDPAGDGFLGLNRSSTATPDSNIDLSVAESAEKCAGGNTWLNPSDRRLKTDITSFDHGLDVVMEINPVWYQYNGILGLSTTGDNVGIIAQELKPIAPYMIIGEENEDEYLSYNANPMFYLLTNAIQQQQEILSGSTNDYNTSDLEETDRGNEEMLTKIEDNVESLLSNSSVILHTTKD